MNTFSLRSSPHRAFIRLAKIAGILAVVIGVTYGIQLIVGHTTSKTEATNDTQPTPNKTPYESTLKQTVVNDSHGAWLATFTWGARTVVMRGPTRTFSEPSSTSVKVTSNYWVRLYPKVYDGSVDQRWLATTTDQNNKQSTPDVIQIAMQYIAGAKPVKDDKGQTVGGDASYGPLLPNGDREEGADFNDYLGIAYAYGKTVDAAEPRLRNSLDNTGFLRMVWGYRAGLPLRLEPSNNSIPRTVSQMLSSASGVVVASNTGRQITDFSQLQVGDIIFNDASSANGSRVDHAAMYLGTDSQGNHRFISSRQAADGPTFGDIGGRAILDGNTPYGRSFRAIRRF